MRSRNYDNEKKSKFPNEEEEHLNCWFSFKKSTKQLTTIFTKRIFGVTSGGCGGGLPGCSWSITNLNDNPWKRCDKFLNPITHEAILGNGGDATALFEQAE